MRRRQILVKRAANPAIDEKLWPIKLFDAKSQYDYCCKCYFSNSVKVSWNPVIDSFEAVANTRNKLKIILVLCWMNIADVNVHISNVVIV